MINFSYTVRLHRPDGTLLHIDVQSTNFGRTETREANCQAIAAERQETYKTYRVKLKITRSLSSYTEPDDYICKISGEIRTQKTLRRVGPEQPIDLAI